MYHTASASICARKRREGLLEVIDSVNLLLYIVQLDTNGGTCRRNVLERSSRGEVERLGQFLHQRVRVERIEKVDVPRRAAKRYRHPLS